MKIRRRGFLSTSAAFLSLCLAGCLGDSLNDLPEYAYWLSEDTEGFGYRNVSELGSDGAEVPVREPVSTYIRAEGVDETVEIDDGVGTVVVRGGFDAEGLGDELEEDGFNNVGGHGGFEVYEDDDGRAFAVTEDAVVSSGEGDTVRRAIDARDGEVPRLVEDDDFGALVDELGTGTEISGKVVQDGGVAGEVASGERLRRGGGLVRVFIFGDEESATEGTVALNNAFEEESPDTDRNGRVVRLTSDGA